VVEEIYSAVLYIGIVCSLFNKNGFGWFFSRDVFGWFIVFLISCFASLATHFFVSSYKEVGKKTPPNTVCPAGARALVTHNLLK